jgi:hypothetical protein
MQNEQNNTPQSIVDIPTIANAKFKANQEKYYENANDFYGYCACCGKGIKQPKFLMNTIYGGCMYPAADENVYDDAWEMPIGNECVKRIPKEYVIKVGA